MPDSPLALDLNCALAPLLEGGLDPSRLEPGGDLAATFRDARDVFERRHGDGELGFLSLPYAGDTARRVRELAEGFGQWFEDVVIVGIGGSGLGALALREALVAPGWNERSDEARGYFPRLRVLDNPDPATVAHLLERVDPARTLFNVVSKSGSTAETMALYLVARGAVEAAVEPDKVRGHFLFTTDPDRGALRRIADAEGIPTLAVPPDVGGRFSVLSPVGLLPAALVGVDIEALLAGARAVDEACRRDDLHRNPAGLLAVVLHTLHREQGRGIHVLMPYADRLRALALWFQQLWAESLGKLRGSEHVGPTPLPALGASDQHAQLQLFMEGPHDKAVVFVRARAEEGGAVPIPGLHADVEELAYLAGHTLDELLDAEQRATAEALRQAGRPSVVLDLGPADAHALGGFLHLCQIATVYAGALYGVDPLDQPGVESGKRMTYGLMGREGFSVPAFPEGSDRWRVGAGSG